MDKIVVVRCDGMTEFASDGSIKWQAASWDA